MTSHRVYQTGEGEKGSEDRGREPPRTSKNQATPGKDRKENRKAHWQKHQVLLIPFNLGE